MRAHTFWMRPFFMRPQKDGCKTNRAWRRPLKFYEYATGKQARPAIQKAIVLPACRLIVLAGQQKLKIYSLRLSIPIIKLVRNLPFRKASLNC